MKKRYMIIFILGALCFAYGLGFLFHDQYFLGSTTLFFGCLQTLLMTQGKWYEEAVGILETITSTTVCIISGLYGSAVFTALVFIPLAIFSLINWKNHENDGKVLLNKMTTAKSVLSISLIASATAIFSLLISIIPGQNLPMFDSATNILNIAGIILIALRYKEGWICWIFCNIVELVMWVVVLHSGFSNNAILMIITSSVYLLLDIWGFWSFIKIRINQEKPQIPSNAADIKSFNGKIR